MKTHLVCSGGGLVACGYLWGFCAEYDLENIEYAHVKSGSTWGALLINKFGLKRSHDFMLKHMVTIGDLYDWNTAEIFGAMFGRKITGIFTHDDLEENINSYSDKDGTPFLKFFAYCFDFKTKQREGFKWDHADIVKISMASSTIGGILKPYKRRYLDLALNGMPRPESVIEGVAPGDRIVFLDAYKPSTGELTDQELTECDWRDYLDVNFQIPLQTKSAEYAVEVEFFATQADCQFVHAPIDVEKSITDFSEQTLFDSIEAGKRAAREVKKNDL